MSEYDRPSDLPKRPDDPAELGQFEQFDPVDPVSVPSGARPEDTQ